MVSLLNGSTNQANSFKGTFSSCCPWSLSFYFITLGRLLSAFQNLRFIHGNQPSGAAKISSLKGKGSVSHLKFRFCSCCAAITLNKKKFFFLHSVFQKQHVYYIPGCVVCEKIWKIPCKNCGSEFRHYCCWLIKERKHSLLCVGWCPFHPFH